MNTAIYSPSGASAGIGFAVPVDTVRRVVPQLIAKGRYVRPTLGISVDEVLNARITQALGGEGVAVLSVAPGSGAARAGLRPARVSRRRVAPGDIIVAVEGRRVDGVGKLLGLLDDYRVGDTVTLSVLRDGKRIEVRVALQAGS